MLPESAVMLNAFLIFVYVSFHMFFCVRSIFVFYCSSTTIKATQTSLFLCILVYTKDRSVRSVFISLLVLKSVSFIYVMSTDAKAVIMPF